MPTWDNPLTVRQQNNMRARIYGKIGRTLARLQECANGEIVMKMCELRAAEILLDRVLPKLSSTEIVGELLNKKVTSEPMSVEDWQREYMDKMPERLEHKENEQKH